MVCALATMAAPAWAARHHKPAADHKADVARDKALTGFQRDLVSVLAPRADALPLLGAALLARPLPNQPDHSNFHALIDRAAQAQDASPAIDWVRLADCDAKADACPNSAALTALQSKATDNAAVWLLKLGDDQRQLHGDAARQDLARAAGAKLYDDYAGISLKALASTVAVLPPPAATLDPKDTAGAAGLQVMMVFGSARAQPQPNLPATAKLCEGAADDAALKDDCLKLGKVLEWGSSPLARSLGLHLRETLADDPAQQEDARHARRNLIWQVQNFAALSARAQTDPAVAQHLLTLARNGGNEMSLMLAALRNAGIATEAPADWKPGS
jgi:hypothetical protein